MLEQYFTDIHQFLSRYQDIWQKEVLEQTPLSKRLESWGADINHFTTNELLQIENDHEIQKIDSEFSGILAEIKELENRLPKFSFNEIELAGNRKISQKKIHEIISLIHLIKNSQFEISEVNDFGGGVGHLCENISFHLGIPSNCIEKDEKLIQSGRERIDKYHSELKDKINFKQTLIKANFKIPSRNNGLSIGLHACGSLTNYLIDFYLNSRNKYFISVGCCYHKYLAGEQNIFNLSSLAKKLNLELSNHAYTLAAKSGSQITPELFEQRIKVKKYRYSFHFLLERYFNYKDFITLGNYPKHLYQSSFEEYALHFLERLKLNLPTNEIELFYNDEKLHQKIDFLLKGGVIRGTFGRLLELYILLDRALYLKENGKEVELVELFDSRISPRNIAIISS